MNPKKILFIGNSYTFYNNLPNMVQKLSSAAGYALLTEQVTVGGKSLQWHWYNPDTHTALAKEAWDFVVLQDHSLQAIEEPDSMQRAAGKLADRIRNIPAKPVLYMTWARKHIPEMQETITAQYLQVGKQIQADVAPVGLAWEAALANNPALSLHTEDLSHPNFLGSYLAACVLYATLFKKTPVGLPSDISLLDGVTTVIDPKKAQFLQETAWASVQTIQNETLT